LDVAYLPPGVQLIAALRVRAIAEHPEGQKVRAALGPLGERAIQYVEQACFVKWQNVEGLVVGFQAMSDRGWKPTLVVHTSDAISQRFRDNLTGAAEKRQGGETYWIAGNRAYYLPSRREGRTLIVAPLEAIADIVELDGDPPPLRRDLERLIGRTDMDRHVTIVVAPNSLFSEGRRIFDGEMARLRRPLYWFLGDEFSAVALSLHWNDDFFIELLAAPTLDTSPERAARILAERAEQVPENLQRYVGKLEVSSHGRDVVGRFPAMVRQLVAYTRRGFEPDHAVLRSYLPMVAGHNLLMGAELALAERPGNSRRVAGATASEATGQAASAGERLQRVTSLRFGRDTLEAALEQLGKDIGLSIEIRGADLQAEGITKNQSFGIDVVNKPAKEILVEILRLANSDKAANGPADERQKLVYVILPAGSGGAERIVVTTRTAAAERGDALPPVFRQRRP
jgi:hypothetical protein